MTGTSKDHPTHELRREIMSGADYIAETDRADLLTITLSFQSTVRPERHVWIDSRMGESGAGFTVELEDWNYEETWDNTVASVDTEDPELARDLTRAWLRGEALDDCLALCAGRGIVHRSGTANS